MTETQKRIRAYKRALPHMKERVIAVALLLAMSVSMMTSATFAWITLSTSPEASSLATTIAANGNLEIALSDKDGLEPKESAVGDGGQDITLSNLTWGNLINLSHDSYGLDYLTLRPASLNPLDLKSSPVYSVDYGADGRVTDYITDFAFSNYTSNKLYEVLTVPQYGVRAVSSVTYKDIMGEQWLIDQLSVIDKAYSAAISSFESIYNTQKSDVAEKYMKSVSYFVGLHVDVYLNGSNPVCEAERIEEIIEMTDKFRDTMMSIGNVIVEIANLYQMLTVSDFSQYTQYTFDDLINGRLADYADRITAINYFTKPQDGNYSPWQKTTMAWNQIVDPSNSTSVYSRVQTNQTIYWDNDLEIPVNYLCDMAAAKLGGYTAEELYEEVKNLNFGAVLGVLRDGTEATITAGAIKDADQLLLSENQKMEVSSSDNIKIAVKYSIINTSIKPTIRTGATAPYLLSVDIKTSDVAAGGGTNLKGTPVAAETYAMAVDMWLRTNAPSAMLILEGELETETTTNYLTDAEGNPILDENGEQLKEEIVTITGYSGVNRVWDEEEMNSVAAQLPSGSISATQGSGSCYVFYPASPEDQAQSLRLLQAMRVAFVDDNGSLLAQASMNTANAVEDAGRVIVPLELKDNPPIELADGTTISKYITPLAQNEPQWITALIYLDGSNLTNSEVLASGAIKGQLNIQFGTTEEGMEPVEDSEVMDDYYLFDVVNSSYDFDSYDVTNNTIKLQIGITGKVPSKVKGNFISFISTTQGARQEEFTMTLNSETGYWEADVPFGGPGNYQLRSLQVDGVDYMLDDSEFVYVTIPGLAVTSLDWELTNTEPMTAASYLQTKMTLTLSSASETFPTVQGVFIGDNGSNVNVLFETTDGRNYTGTATFTSSGNYELSYVYIDGTITPLDEMSKSLSVKLGLRTYVRLSEPVLSGGEDENVLKEVTFDSATGWSFVYSMDKPLTFAVSCDIFDDQGNRIPNLTGVELNYSTGSVRDALSADMTWNPTSKQYEGEFGFQNSGMFVYQDVKIGDANTITVADYAPSIQSIPPTPMEYYPQKDYDPYVYDLGMDKSNRVLLVKLKNASAASLEVTMTHTAADGSTNDVTKVVSATTTDDYGDYTVSTFRVEADSDGQWDITGLKASSVFYDGKFYAGGKDVLDLTELVVDDEIGTYFLTEAKVTVTGNYPTNTSYSGAFMESGFVSAENNPMVISVCDYQGNPLEQTLRSLGIGEEVTIDMEYIWTQASNYSISGGTAMNQNFGVESQNEDGTVTMEQLNFKLAGSFTPKWTITIGGKEYSYDGKGQLPSELIIASDSPIVKQFIVTWTAPEVKFTATNPAVGTAFAVRDTSNNYSETGGANGITNSNHTLTAYFVCTRSGSGSFCDPYSYSYAPTTATAELTGAGGSFTSATLTIDGTTNDMVYIFTTGSLIQTVNVGSVNSRGAKQAVGNGSASTIALVKDGVTYTVDLKYALNVVNTY